jgi:hypothetical protein
VRGHELERPPAVSPPEEARFGAGRLDGEPDHLFGRPRLVRARRERVARYAEDDLGIARARSLAIAAERPDRQSGLSCRESRQPPLALVERGATSHDLDASAQPAVDVNRQHDDELRSNTLGCAPDRLGQAGRIGFLRLGDEAQLHARPLELRGDDRRRARNGRGAEPAPARVRDAHHHRIGMGGTCEHAGERLHCLGQGRGQAQGERGLGEGIEATLVDPGFLLAWTRRHRNRQGSWESAGQATH